ncbi:MAG: hypothetical protein JXQ76_00585 [Campylobacterales bacterium]|nr:hypothetical protein [Campylobacterales bacterium]
MITEMIWYHAMTIYLFIFVLIASLAIPVIYIHKAMHLVRYSRIVALSNYSLLVMIAFDGMITMIMSERGWSINMILMVIAFFLLLFAEILKGYKLKHLVLSQNRDFKAYQHRYIAIVAAQLLIILPFILIYN